MPLCRTWRRWLAIVAALLGAAAGPVPRARSEPADDGALARAVSPIRGVPLADLPAGVRDGVGLVMKEPTLSVHGPAEVFHGRPAMYQWLLDHPDQGVLIWRRLGAQCLDVTRISEDRFGWSDGRGSAVAWQTVHRGPHVRVWYAEGSGRPAPVLPAVPVRAVVVLRYEDARDAGGRSVIRHQADLFLQTDSKTAALVTRLLGPSAPRLAEQGVAQMELFFSALVWYLDRHPDRVDALLWGTLPEQFGVTGH